MQGHDVLVKAIFETVNQHKASPEDKRSAIARAGLIAQAYVVDAGLLFEQDNDVNRNPAARENSGTA